MHLKRIPMDGPQNFRDIGGFLNREGRAVKWNQLYRADGMGRLSQADMEKLRELQIRTIIDLRGEAEQRVRPDLAPEGIVLVSCPMMREEFVSEERAAEHTFARSLALGYQNMISEGAELIGAAARAVMEALERGAAVYHCTAGKDRTGILTAVLLLLLGAYEEDIVADYQVSHTYNEKGINLMVEQNPKLQEFLEHMGEDSMLHSHPKNIKKVLELLTAGNIAEWLEKAGVPAALQEQFRSRMLEG